MILSVPAFTGGDTSSSFMRLPVEALIPGPAFDAGAPHRVPNADAARDHMILTARSHPTAWRHPNGSPVSRHRVLAPVLGLTVLALTATQGRTQETPSAQTPRITRTAPPVPTSRQGTVLDVPATAAATPAAPEGAAPAPVTEAPSAATALPAPSAEAKADAAANGRVESGLLECKGEMATAYGFGSTRGITCEFRPAAGVNQYYTGTLSRVGLDFGVSDQASMIWMVLATTRQLGPGALAGEYVGFSSGAALGPGFSANVLMAKDATTGIALQPLSVSSDSGLSISFAAAGLTLTPSKAQRH